MARVTIEDCVNVVPNRFELVLLAAQRARDISAGQDILVDRDNDKNAVVALREIAEGNLLDLENLKSNIVRGVNRHDIGVSEDERLSQQIETQSDVAVSKVVDLGFSEIEHESDSENISEDDVLAAAEELFSTEGDE